MIYFTKKNRKSYVFRFLSTFMIFIFLSYSIIMPSYAQSIINLPVPGTMVMLSPAFTPVLLKGMTLYLDAPFKFDFIIDNGNTGLTQNELKAEAEKLVRYFLAAMTIPEDDLWVNLSPHEGDRIIPDGLSRTELGRDLLVQDYLLKQLSASLIYPEEELGAQFWEKIYAKAGELYGTTEIPVNTFNKIWIVPERATVYEHEQTVYVVDTHLKVLVDSDYQAMKMGKVESDTMEMGGDIFRKLILPEIEKEVNEGENFALLRQIYHSLILAQWYKNTIKDSLMSRFFIDGGL